MVPELASSLIKEPVDTFRTDVFVVVASIVVIVPVVDCRVVIVATDAFKTEVFVIMDFKSIKEPCDTFRTEVFVVDA